MRIVADKRHILAPLIAGLLLLAVVGPVCLLRASEAYAMTMTKGDCDGGTSGSLSTCPHQNPQKSTSAPQRIVTAPDAQVAEACAILPPDPTPAPVTDGFSVAPAPGPLIAPLRI